MKTKNFFIVLAVIATALVFASCNKNTNVKTDKNDSELMSKAVLNANYQNALYAITYSCSGSCTAPTGCSARWNLKTGEMVCECEGCHVIVSDEKAYLEKNEFISDFKSIANFFVDYIYELHNDIDYKMDKVVVFGNEKFEFVEIEYSFYASKEMYSVVFKTEASNKLNTTLIVDCTGSCPDNSCVEGVNVKTGEVYCKCESDNCKMRIEQISQHYLSKYF